MELNVDIDAIVLYGVGQIDRERLAADIARRLELHLLSDSLARDSGDATRFSADAVAGNVSEAGRLSNRMVASAAEWSGSSIGDRPSREALGGDRAEARQVFTGVGNRLPGKPVADEHSLSEGRRSGGPVADEHSFSEGRRASEASPPTPGGSRQFSSGSLSAGSSIADCVADAVWTRLRRAAMEDR